MTPKGIRMGGELGQNTSWLNTAALDRLLSQSQHYPCKALSGEEERGAKSVRSPA